MRRQVGRVVAAVAIVGATVAGCGSGPSQVGSAVIIGSESISLSTVQDRIAVALGPEKAQFVATVNQELSGAYGPREVAQEVLTDAVLHDLLARRVVEEGISVSESDVDAQLASTGTVADAEQASLYTGAALRENVRDDLLAAALGAEYVDRLGVTLDATVFATEAEALGAARIIAAGGPAADQVFAAMPEDRRLSAEVTAAENPAEASQFTFGTQEGAVVVLSPQQDGSPWQIIRITERRTDLSPTGPSATDRFGPQDLQLIGYRLLQESATELGVTVNPRYGVWDPIRLGVVPEEQVPGVIVLPPGPAAAS